METMDQIRSPPEAPFLSAPVCSAASLKPFDYCKRLLVLSVSLAKPEIVSYCWNVPRPLQALACGVATMATTEGVQEVVTKGESLFNMFCHFLVSGWLTSYTSFYSVFQEYVYREGGDQYWLDLLLSMLIVNTTLKS